MSDFPSPGPHDAGADQDGESPLSPTGLVLPAPEPTARPRQVRAQPCPSCPYRRDAPSGIWDACEYEKLLGYDGPVSEQTGHLFLCHQGAGQLCAGWVAHRDPADLLALRIAVITERVAPEVFEYRTAVDLFGSGREAHDHGVADLHSPTPQAREAVRKIVTVRTRRSTQPEGQQQP